MAKLLKDQASPTILAVHTSNLWLRNGRFNTIQIFMQSAQDARPMRWLGVHNNCELKSSWHVVLLYLIQGTEDYVIISHCLMQ